MAVMASMAIGIEEASNISNLCWFFGPSANSFGEDKMIDAIGIPGCQLPFSTPPIYTQIFPLAASSPQGCSLNFLQQYDIINAKIELKGGMTEMDHTSLQKTPFVTLSSSC